jgi:hypothetical protein
MLRKLAFVALLVAAVPASAVVALAQPSPQEVVEPSPIIESQVTPPTVTPAPVAEESGADFTPFLKLLTDTLSAALLAIVTAGIAWLTAQISKLTAGRIKLDDLTKDIQMEGYARQAVDKALNYALTKTGYSYSDLQNVHVKPQILQYVVGFLASQYPEVIRWVDTNENGVIDWVETHLPVPLQMGPQPVQAQAFMANTPGKAPRAPRAPRQPTAAPATLPDMA